MEITAFDSWDAAAYRYTMGGKKTKGIIDPKMKKIK